jgi:hypothetical protein
MASNEHTPTFVANLLLKDVTPFIKKEPEVKPEDYWEGVSQGFNMFGRWWGFPYDCSTFAIYYNKEMFQAAGVPFPASEGKKPWTLDEFLDFPNPHNFLLRTDRNPDYHLLFPCQSHSSLNKKFLTPSLKPATGDTTPCVRLEQGGRPRLRWGRCWSDCPCRPCTRGRRACKAGLPEQARSRCRGSSLHRSLHPDQRSARAVPPLQSL